MKTKFSQRLHNIIESGAQRQSLPQATTKTASSSDVSVDGLRKIANILRTTSVEPSYDDVYEMYARIKR